MLSLTTRAVEDVLVVDFVNKEVLDTADVSQVGEDFDRLALEAGPRQKILLNLANVEYISSAVIGKIVRLNKQCRADKISLKLCGISPGVKEIFKTTMLDKIFDIQQDEDSALAALTNS